MNQEFIRHYNTHYQYPLPDGTPPGDAVNQLFDRILQDDKDALEQAVHILTANTYYLVVDRLSKHVNPAIQDIDNIMQDVRMQVIRLAFRGIPEWVTKEGFYGYLLRLVERRIQDYQRKMGKLAAQEISAAGEEGMLTALNGQEELPEHGDPETVYLIQEQREAIRQVIHFFLQALRETELPPWQILTYCYAVLIPQLFKKSDNPKFLKRVETVSGRNGKQPNSRYNPDKGCLEGEITRNSVILIKWAMDAMEQMLAGGLSEEFLDLYNAEPLNDETFAWGEAYLANMEKEIDGIPLKDLVILEQFSKNAIKNWPGRVAENLLTETEERVHADEAFGRNSVRIVETLIGREG